MLRGVEVRVKRECHQFMEREAFFKKNKKMNDLPPPRSFFIGAGLHAEGFSSSLYKALQHISGEVGFFPSLRCIYRGVLPSQLC